MVPPAPLNLSRYTSEQLCARIFLRHASRIRVKKQHVAVGNLVRIVDAFLKLTTRNGFHATSLRDLAAESGLSMGGLYSYFDSKETLLVMVLEEVEEAVRELLASAPADVVADPRRNLLWLIDAHIRLTEAMQRWFVFAYMEAKSFPKTAKTAAIDSELVAERTIADILRRGVERGAFAVADIELTAAIVKPLLQDWYVKRAKYRRRGVSVGDYVSTVSALVMDGIDAGSDPGAR
ncbi:MAG: TetR/AcrR family transcriptional regulator [Rhizobiaceae bacterium]